MGDGRPTAAAAAAGPLLVLLLLASLLLLGSDAFQSPPSRSAALVRRGLRIVVVDVPSSRLDDGDDDGRRRRRRFRPSSASSSARPPPRREEEALRAAVDGGDDGERKGRRRGGKKPFQTSLVAMKKLASNLAALVVSFPSRFAGLSRRGKIIVSARLLATVLLLGAAGRRVAVSKSAGKAPKPSEVSYSSFLDLCERNGKGHVPGENPAIKIDDVVIGRDRLNFRVSQDDDRHRIALADKKLAESNDVAVREVAPQRAYARRVVAPPELLEFLRKNNVPFRAASTKGTNAAATSARAAIFVVYLLFLLRMYRTMSGGGGGGSGAPGKLAAPPTDGPLVTFEDIEGIDSAKFEVMELVDTLRNPGKYAILGARAPTGLLLEGPPGTGKTMLARATAATAGVPLLYCSGSDFVEMFVGRGAARVRKTFARAAKLAPCIIFIDELDALGKSRDSGIPGMNVRSNDEAEQTLNQLLACMDGLDSSRGVCVLAATNRREVLDPALVRPGRFDRIIKVELPDAAGRERILRVHAKKLPGFKEGKGVDEKRLGSLGKGTTIDLSAVAAVTPGLSGAELEFIVNEAAIRAVRRVSSQLRDGFDPNKVVPSVDAEDFEGSVKNFFETRKSNPGGMGELLSNVLRK